MASKEDLVRIGREGFDMVDQFFDNKRKNGAAAAKKPHAFPKGTRQVCLYQYQPQQSHVYYVNPNEKTNAYEVKQFHDGVPLMDYNKRNSAPMFY